MPKLPQFALALGLLAACADSGGEQALALELGSGELRFEAFEDGASLALVAGSQGGYHVWLSLRTPDVGLTRLPLRIEMGPGQTPGEASERSELSLDFRATDDYAEHTGFPAQIARDPACLVGEAQWIRVTPTAEGSAAVRRWFVPSSDALSAEDCRP